MNMNQECGHHVTFNDDDGTRDGSCLICRLLDRVTEVCAGRDNITQMYYAEKARADALAKQLEDRGARSGSVNTKATDGTTNSDHGQGEA